MLNIENLKLIEESTSINEVLDKNKIIGLAGLDGHGQEEFLESLAGLYQPFAGQVKVTTNTVKKVSSLYGAYLSGISYLPANRKKNGIFPGQSVLDNFRLGRLDQFSSMGFINHALSKKVFAEFTNDLSIKFASLNSPIDSLSGGNQQKVLLARCLIGSPQIVLLNDPTRGVDMQTRKTIYSYLTGLKKSQTVLVVILSTELEEIVEFCDEVYVFKDFSLVKKYDKSNMTVDSVLSGMFGKDL